MDSIAQAADLIKSINEIRADGWSNIFTGLGTSRDRRKYSDICLDTGVDYTTVRNLYRFNSLAKKLATLRIDDALRDGIRIAVANKPKLERQITQWLADYNVLQHIIMTLHAMRWSGGGALFPVLNKGKISVEELATPLDYDSIESIDGFVVFNSEQLRAVAYYNGPLLPNYNCPALYRIYPVSFAPMAQGGSSDNIPVWNTGAMSLPQTNNGTMLIHPEIHESRLVTWSGPVADPRQRIERWGWGDTCYDLLWDRIRDIDTAFSSVATAIDEFSVSVYKIAGLTEIAGNPEAEQRLKARLSIMQLGKSMYRAAVLNKGDAVGNGDEELTRSNVPFTGIYEVLSMFMSWVAGAADYPVTRLFAQSPKGLGNEGESDIKNYNTSLLQTRNQIILPGVQKLMKMVLSAKSGPTKGKIPDKWSIVFPPLHSPSQKEIAEANYMVAQTDDILIRNKVLSPMEVRISHYSSDTFNPEVQLDDSEYTKFLDTAQKSEDAQLAKTKQAIINAQPADNDQSVENSKKTLDK